jgi:TolA protein
MVAEAVEAEAAPDQAQPVADSSPELIALDSPAEPEAFSVPLALQPSILAPLAAAPAAASAVLPSPPQQLLPLPALRSEELLAALAAAATQREAAQREALRKQEQQQQQELARQQAARAEAAKLEEATRQEAAARLEAARAEQARQEAAAAAAQAARAEAARQAAAKAEAEAEANAAAARTAAAAAAAARAAEDEQREARRRAIGRQLDAEAAQREASSTARPGSNLPYSVGSARRGRLFGRSDPNAELVLYAEAWSRKIEFNPGIELVREAAQQPHSDPLVTVAVRSDGSVESISFVRSSGVPAIDEAVRRIVQSHANYPPFQPALAREFDVIEIRRSWHFDTAIRLY